MPLSADDIANFDGGRAYTAGTTNIPKMTPPKYKVFLTTVSPDMAIQYFTYADTQSKAISEVAKGTLSCNSNYPDLKQIEILDATKKGLDAMVLQGKSPLSDEEQNRLTEDNAEVEFVNEMGDKPLYMCINQNPLSNSSKKQHKLKNTIPSQNAQPNPTNPFAYKGKQVLL